MSHVAQNLVLDHSKSKGASRLVFLALCRYIKFERWRDGEPAEAYPSQSTLAKLCNCSRSTVERALEQLQELGEIHDTGERWKRLTVIYGLTLLDEGRDGAFDLTDPGSGQTDMTRGGSGRGDENHDLTDPASDLTDLGVDLTDPGRNLTQDESQDGCKAVVKKGRKEGSSDALDFRAPPPGISPSAKHQRQPGSGSSRPPAQEIAEALEDAREVLRQRTEAFDAAEIGTPEKQDAYRLKSEQEATVAQLEGRPTAVAA